jgi:hypothetical protein
MKTTWVLGLVAVAGVAALTTLAARTRSPAAADPRSAIFIRRGCNECHAISAFKIPALHDVAPDLTYAYGDVVLRYGVDLETFLDNPSGVMRLMLGSHIRLSPVDRDSIVQVLKGLYAQRVASRERGDSSLRSE